MKKPSATNQLYDMEKKKFELSWSTCHIKELFNFVISYSVGFVQNNLERGFVVSSTTNVFKGILIVTIISLIVTYTIIHKLLSPFKEIKKCIEYLVLCTHI